MKISLLASTILLVSSSAAFATVNDTDWNGFYVGGGIGKTFATSKVNYAHSTTTCSNNNYGSDAGGGCGGTQNYSEALSQDMTNTSGSIHGGYSWQMNSLVFAIEPGITIKNQDKDHHEIISSAFGDTLDIHTEQNYSASIRANIGMPIRNVLVYATGGASAGRVETSITQLAIGTTARTLENDDTQYGYTVGGGMKFHIAANWIIGGEVLYTDLGDSKLSAPQLVMPGGLTYPVTQVKTRNSAITTQINLSYQF